MKFWVLLLYKVPSEPTSRRVYVWRKLKRLGAILLHDAAWMLPATPHTREQLQWLAAEIEEMNGEAFVWESTLAYGQDEVLVRQFLAQAEATYGNLLEEAEQPEADLPTLSRRYQQARSQDYFQSELGQRIEAVLLQRRGGVTLPPTVIFLCPHNAAKSVIAAALFKRLAQQRGLDVQVTSAGTEPDEHVSPAVVELLRAEGIDVSDHRPNRVTGEALQMAFHVVSMGCDVSELAAPDRVIKRWDDIPAPSRDPEGALTAIRLHVEELVDELTRGQGGTTV